MRDRFVWATVTAVDPLRIRLDGDSTPLDYTPKTLIAADLLSVDDRVRCEFTVEQRVVVHGLKGGALLYTRAEVDALLATGFRLVETLYFTSGDTFEKADYPDCRAIRVLCVGAGGGGGGAAATGGNYSNGTGGGGGGYAESFITDIAGLASSIPITVGAGGTAPSGGTGGTGGSSSFGTIVAASGGVGGNVKPANIYSPYVSAPLGGIGTAGDLLIRGQGGTIGAGSDTLGSSGTGGSSQLGGGAPGVGSGSTGAVGVAGGNYGGGGSGAFNSSSQGARAGGVGAQGIVIVELFA